MAYNYTFTAALSESMGWFMSTSQLTDDPFEIALLVYDTLLTFSDEIENIWHKKLKLGTILYLLARYPTLLRFILYEFLQFISIPLQVRFRLDVH